MIQPQYGVIYMSRNMVTGEQYIGKTINYEKRKAVHLRAKEDTALAEAIRTFGKENFEFKILYDRIPEWMLASLEERSISTLNTFLGFGYNKSKGKGGNIGLNHPSVSREVIRDIKLISRRYLNGEAACKIAEEYKVGTDTITNHLRKNGIEVRSHVEQKQFRLNQAEDRIIGDYKNGKSINQISKDTGISRKVIRKLLNDNDVPIRSNKRLDLQLRANEVVSRYLEGFSVRNLTKQFKCDAETIYKILRNEGIQLRSRSEQMKLSLARNQGKENVTAE